MILVQHRQHWPHPRVFVDHQPVPHTPWQLHRFEEASTAAREERNGSRGPTLLLGLVLDALDIPANRHHRVVAERGILAHRPQLVQLAVHVAQEGPCADARIDGNLRVHRHHWESVAFEAHDPAHHVGGDHERGRFLRHLPFGLLIVIPSSLGSGLRAVPSPTLPERICAKLSLGGPRPGPQSSV